MLAAVMVWIHGGGFYEGHKNVFNGAGLITQSKVNGGDGIVFIKLNYRLGLFVSQNAFNSIIQN